MHFFVAMNRQHIRNAEWQLAKAKEVFYTSDKSEVREHLYKAIRHITKTLLRIRYER